MDSDYGYIVKLLEITKNDNLNSPLLFSNKIKVIISVSIIIISNIKNFYFYRYYYRIAIII